MGRMKHVAADSLSSAHIAVQGVTMSNQVIPIMSHNQGTDNSKT